MELFVLMASGHHLLAFGLVAILIAELCLLPLADSPARYRTIGRIDLWYGALAGLLLLLGFARVFFGEADSDFYTANPVFWVKIGVFVLIGLASLPPTIRFLQWNNRMKQDPARLPGEGEKSRVMAWLKAELALFVLMPVLAAAMARGVGL